MCSATWSTAIISFTASRIRRAYSGGRPAGRTAKSRSRPILDRAHRRGCGPIMRRWNFVRAAAETRAIWSAANAYLQEAAPWTSIKSDPARAAIATRTAIEPRAFIRGAGLEHHSSACGNRA